MSSLSHSAATSSGKAENKRTGRRHPKPSPLGDFAQIPQEVRELIFAPVFAHGSVALTRASKALHESTKRSLYRYGVYRIHIKSKIITWNNGWFEEGWEFGSEAQGIVPYALIAKVQNLEIRTTFRYTLPDDLSPAALTRDELAASFHNDHCRKIIGRLAAAMDSAKHCHIQLTRRALKHIWDERMRGVWSLAEFESVTVELTDDYHQRWLQYMDEPQKDNELELAELAELFRPKEGTKEPRFSIVRNPPKDFFLPLGHPLLDDDLPPIKKNFRWVEGGSWEIVY